MQRRTHIKQRRAECPLEVLQTYNSQSKTTSMITSNSFENFRRHFLKMNVWYNVRFLTSTATFAINELTVTMDSSLYTLQCIFWLYSTLTRVCRHFPHVVWQFCFCHFYVWILCRVSAASTCITRSYCTDYPRLTTQLLAAVCENKPRDSRENISVAYCMFVPLTIVNYHFVRTCVRVMIILFVSTSNFS